MDSLLVIQDKLKRIAQSANLTGQVVDGLILLLSESIYRGNVGNVTELLEKSFSRCRLLNSAITHATDRSYSVYRGRNQVFRMKNVLPLSSFSVKKFDTAVEVGLYKLVYSKDYSFSSMVSPGNVDLILCPSVEGRSVSFTASNLYKASIKADNISEDVIIYRDNLEKLSETPSSRIFSDCVRGVKTSDGKVTYPLWVCTKENFGINIYALKESNKYKTDETVYIKYLPYLENTISEESIPLASGFISTAELTGDYVTNQDQQKVVYNYENLGRSERQSNIAEIFTSANASMISGGIVKSYSDIKNIILEKYGHLVGSIDIKFDFTTNLDKFGAPIPVIIISYTNKKYETDASRLDEMVNVEWLSSGEGTAPSIAFRIPEFSSEMKESYYIDEDIIFVKPKDRVFPTYGDFADFGKSFDNIDEGKILIKVYFEGETEPDISEPLNKYHNTFYKKLNLSRLASDIQDVDNVKYVEFFVYKKGEQLEIPLITLDMNSSESAVVTVGSYILEQKQLQSTEFDIEYISFS